VWYEFATGERFATMLTVERLKEVLMYEPESGRFIHLPRPGSDQPTKTWNTRYAGKIAGRVRSDGRRQLCIDKKFYLAARVAWLYMTGKWPNPEVDHENTDCGDDRWDNLREASRQQNACNTRLRHHSKAGLKGVRWHRKNKKWEAKITVHSRQIYLGCYITKEAAHQAYCSAAARLHGDFARSA
jgi:hypothetical protein